MTVMPPALLPLPARTTRPAPRARSRREAAIVAAARGLLEAVGSEGLTMRRLAGELGIRAPSLYKHLASRAALEVALVEDALDEIGCALHAAVAASEADPVGDLLAAYRAAGRAHPELYRLATAQGFPRDALLPGLEQWAGEPFYLVTGEPYRAQALWSFAHGTLLLELDRRFLPGSDLDRTWRTGAAAFAAAGTAAPGSPGG